MIGRSILGLFAESPFGPLRDLAHKVAECAEEVPAIFDAFFEGDYEAVRAKAKEISKLEHEADLLKDKVRDKLPKTIFLPVDRRDLLEVVASLDAIADVSEDVGILFTLREMEPHEELVEGLQELLPQVMEVVDQMIAIIDRLDVLVEVGFRGPETEHIKKMVEELGRREHEADVIQDELARTLFSEIGDDIQPGSLFLWNKILNKVGDVANTAEKAGTRIRLFIAQ